MYVCMDTRTHARHKYMYVHTNTYVCMYVRGVIEKFVSFSDTEKIMDFKKIL